jgi:hypothetical protein
MPQCFSFDAPLSGHSSRKYWLRAQQEQEWKVNPVFRISKGPDLSELVASVDDLPTFAREHGHGTYQIEELSPSCGFASWGSAIHQDDGRVLITRRPHDPVERLGRAVHHEAGHAVMMIESGIAFNSIEITEEGLEVGGTVQKTEPFKLVQRGVPPSPDEEKEILRDLDCLAAGSAAEALAFPSPDPDQFTISISDVNLMIEILEGLCLSSEILQLFQIKAYARARARLSRPEIWAQVEALAARLASDKKVSSLEATEICSGARSSAISQRQSQIGEKLLDDRSMLPGRPIR